MTDGFTVDLDWLNQQATTLDWILDLTSKDRKLADGYVGGLGSGTVADKLNEVLGNWTKERDTLHDLVERLGKGCRYSVQVYEKLERSNASGFTPGGK
ncbi:MAG: hypothetical protein ACJ73S_30630 [Mycobacteriales bacterium]